MRRFLAAGLVTLALGIVSPAFSAEESVDQKFAADAAMDSMAEVELGRLAVDKSDNPKVREFANRMIQDHSKANMQLASIAKSANVVLPSEPGEKLQKPMNMLSGLSDKDFDRAYVKEMVKDHEKAVKLFQKYQRESSNKELGAFAQQTLPILEEHLQMAQTLEKGLSGK
jgi:putative membrane protein